MQFSNITGQEEIKKQLIGTVHDNRVSHAQLFAGPVGSGGLALAIAYAQFLNCLDKQLADSCGQCSNCRKYEKYIHPDLHFSYPFYAKQKVDTATNFVQEWRELLLRNPFPSFDDWREANDVDNKQANINIAEAHDIIKKLSLKAYEAEYKVLIMWLPEYLNKEGNALLKLIEEPPAKTLFILVSENTDGILNTILSRTQLVKVRPFRQEEIVSYLQKHYELEGRENEIALMSEGNLSLARHLAEERGEPFFELMVQWLRFIVTDSGKSLISYCEERLATLGRENQKSFLRYTLQLMRAVVLTRAGVPHLQPLPPEQEAFVSKFAEIYQIKQVNNMINLVEQAIYHIERNSNAKLLFLDLSLQLVLVYKYNTFRVNADSII